MKKINILIAAFVLLTSPSAKGAVYAIDPEKPTLIVKDDKQFLLDYFEKTEQNLLKNVGGMSIEQQQYKTAPEKWSVSQCLEHIVLMEEHIFEMVEKLMQSPANPERRGEIKISKEDLVNRITDRSKKAQAPEELKPSGKNADVGETIKVFEKQRVKIRKYIENTPLEDMRSHITDSPFGAMDAYQSLLFIAAHTARHTLQIVEVKTNAGFPSK
ncbi:DinB family protein [Olivibacter jilunii]|uniref:DinB family protein n=1 Tax=Olivibacter jilunii TaxID=985016 RepID=UPI003F18C1FD